MVRPFNPPVVSSSDVYLSERAPPLLPLLPLLLQVRGTTEQPGAVWWKKKRVRMIKKKKKLSALQLQKISANPLEANIFNVTTG